MPATTTPGRVYVVGAGPGDPGLLTCRGAEVLAEAEIVFYDYLVNPQLLELVPDHAPRHCLGRHGHGHRDHERLWSLDEIVAALVAAAREGRRVVRLKGGDPLVFGHLAEEVAGLNQAGITYEIVPGITTALAVGATAGVPLTHRAAASAVALVAGHEDQDKLDPQVDWAALARFPGTLVIYMGVTTVDDWSRALLAAGRSAETPVLVVRRATWPNQVSFATTLAQAADETRRRRLRPPAVFVVGEVVAERFATPWLAERPLAGQRVLVLRAEPQGRELRDRLARLGAEVLLAPVIEIADPPAWEPVDKLLAGLEQLDWLVFSSVNGVEYFCRRLWSRGGDARRLGHVKLAAIGPGTAAALENWRLRADLVPEEFRAEGLAAALASQVGGQRVALIRASRGREVLAQALAAAGAEVTQVVAYTSRDVESLDPEISAALAGGRIDWVLVTSSAIARAAARLLGEGLRRARLASLSPVTSATLRELGYEPTIEARTYTLDGLVKAVLGQGEPE